MEKYKVKLPSINLSQYKDLINALQFYRLSSIEFSSDSELIANIYILIDYIEETREIIEI